MSQVRSNNRAARTERLLFNDEGGRAGSSELVRQGACVHVKLRSLIVHLGFEIIIGPVEKLLVLFVVPAMDEGIVRNWEHWKGGGQQIKNVGWRKRGLI